GPEGLLLNSVRTGGEGTCAVPAAFSSLSSMPVHSPPVRTTRKSSPAPWLSTATGWQQSGDAVGPRLHIRAFLGRLRRRTSWAGPFRSRRRVPDFVGGAVGERVLVDQIQPPAVGPEAQMGPVAVRRRDAELEQRQAGGHVPQRHPAAVAGLLV